MGWTYSYYCERLGVTFNQGDKLIVKGKGYKNSGPDSAVGHDYTNEPIEKVFYGVYSNEQYPEAVAHPINCKNADGSGSYYFDDASIYQNVSGTPNTYNVTLDANGGTLPSESVLPVRMGTGDYSIIGGYLPKRTGYIFNGFYTSKSGGSKVYDSEGKAVNGAYWNGSGSSATWKYMGNVTLYAQWTANTYTITYKANGGVGEDKTQKVTYGVSWKTESSIFTKTGYMQTSWNTKADGSGDRYGLNTNQTNKQLSNVVLYAIYTPVIYKLTINPNGGTWDGYTSSQEILQEYGTAKEIVNPTRIGYNFIGWSVSGEGSLDGTIYTYGAGNGTLTAQWERISLTVTFDASTNGGSPNSTKSIYYGDAVGTLPTPKKPYYKFIGWFTGPVGGVQVSKLDVITSNVTYYAQFKLDATVKVGTNGEKKPAIVWIGRNGVWKKHIVWIGKNRTWNKSTGAD